MKHVIPAVIIVILLGSIAASAARAPVTFITFGDWGTGTNSQKEVAQSATRYCRNNSCEFVVALGDNFYENGVKSVHDPKWKNYYKDIYAALNLPFYAVIGNHDERNNVDAQIDYSKIDPSWHMPGRFYSARFPNDTATPTIEIFVINNGDHQLESAEQKWLSQALAKSRARWKILAMHIPIISNGPHGDDSADINDNLIPVICGKVDVVLAGHDHAFAHLRGPWKNCAIDQLVVGTGGKHLYSVNEKDPRVLSTGSFFGFGWFEATDKKLVFRMIKEDGSVYYTTEWKK
ncbi:MAG: hypothetical protein COV45_07750 [Deltaproteobacteria bacterium CG11_big_fil_rev_8_21_14_0_20_47_16]|nr:MAG: hypothetical protein COV45_07750 [Deltaproteobacteria bacterium CG11_big_fil_rev_8_21_14_0_20_47_16]